MKALILIVLLSSCSVFEGAKDALTGSYELGKARGRAEVLRDLKENKKKLDPFLELSINDLLEMKESEASLPLALTITKLLLDRNKLKRQLEIAIE